ncbi:MAG: hypothetical protein SPJ04_02005 [Bdellovibrionota bacterium]|nr:hypothetical protein [Pseudomonadota bacterium]MDY6090011.1 hypothetical protein [Bdellovibrionota bacterium]
MAKSSEFSENYYVKEFLTYYAGFLANLTEDMKKEADENLNELCLIDEKAKNLLTTPVYTKFKKKKSNLIKSFNEKLLQNIDDKKVLKSLDVAKESLEKFNI